MPITITNRSHLHIDSINLLLGKALDYIREKEGLNSNEWNLNLVFNSYKRWRVTGYVYPCYIPKKVTIGIPKSDRVQEPKYGKVSEIYLTLLHELKHTADAEKGLPFEHWRLNRNNGWSKIPHRNRIQEIRAVEFCLKAKDHIPPEVYNHQLKMKESRRCG